MTIKDIINDVIQSGQYTSSAHEGGKYVQAFEEELHKYVGRDTILVNSGTSALVTALHLSGVTAGSEVIIPAYSFVATANAVKSLGAIPIPVDIKIDDFTIDTDLIEEKITPNTRAVIAVHLYGNIADIKKIKGITKLPVIEDACQAFGSYNEHGRAGALGDYGCFSFYPSKIINTMEGGAVTVESAVDSYNARSFRNHGDDNGWGLNLRMNEISAGMGLEQIKTVSETIQQRKITEKTWYDILKKNDDIQINPPQLNTNGQLLTFLAFDRHKWLDKLPQARVYYDYTLDPTNSCPNAIYASEHTVSIPLS